MRRLPAAACLFAAALLAACTSTQDVLEPSAIAPPASVAGGTEVGMAPPASAPAAQNPPQTAAVTGRARLRLDPIVGASVEAAGPLTERLAAAARARGLGLAGSADQAATHVLKGYFSTVTEGGANTVIYVWDVYDPSGNRLHRINGQQAAGSGEGWTSVPPQAMQAIADATVDQLASWLAGRTG